MTLEIALGRWLACLAHPCAAWPLLLPRHRAALVGSYVGAGYVITLAGLLANG